MLRASILLALLAQPAPAPVVPPPPSQTIPDTEIVAPETAVIPGRQIRLAIKAPSKLPEGVISVGYAWVISPDVGDDLDEWPDHTHISFGAGRVASTFHVIVVTSWVLQNEKTTTQVMTKTPIDVQVSDPPPLPTPPPVNPVIPVPSNPLPDGKFKLASYMYNLCKGMPPAETTKLGDALSSVAKATREGTYTTKGQVVGAVALATRSALGTSLDSWKPLLDHLAATMNTMKAVVVSPQDTGVAYDEIATGLYAIGKQ